MRNEKKARKIAENYGLDPAKATKPHPLVMDDRVISKQYITRRVDSKVDNTVFGASWDNVTDVAPSKDALFEYLNSLPTYSDVWTKKEDTVSSNVRARKTGNYAIGPINFTSDSDWEKLYVAGNIKSTGDIILADTAQVGPTSAGITFHSTNGAKIATNFAIGANDPSLPFEINKSGSTAGNTDGTGIIQLGADGGANLGIDATNLQARDGAGAAAAFSINPNGGAVNIGSSGVTTTIKGHLTVEGSAVTTISEELKINDNLFILNANQTGTGDANAGVEVERGDYANVGLRFNGTTNTWQIQSATDDAVAGSWSNIQNAASGGTVNQINTNTANALSLTTTTTANDTINLADKFLQIAGDTATGAMTFGSAGNQTDNDGDGTTMLTVYGGPNTGNAALVVNGHLSADTKSFDIPHPIKKNMRLVHGTLEGPEFGMYQRGTLKSSITMEEIPLPAYWGKLVSDYTVSLTPHGNYNVWLVEKHKNMFEIKTNWDAIDGPWQCDWVVIGRRNDYPLEVEQ